MALVTGSLGGTMNHGDLLAEATNSIVLPMTAEGVHTMTYNPNPTTSIVGKITYSRPVSRLTSLKQLEF